MRSKLLPLATRLVRAWTRVYTYGLPRAERTARRAEIDSDLWEFEHDPEAPQGRWAATQVLARLLIGIPDDLAWRMDVGATAHRAPVRALAAAGMTIGPSRVSAFGLSATIHVVAISAVVWLASRGAVPSPNPGEAAVQSVSIPGNPRAVGVVSAVAVNVAVRVGLITPPRLRNYLRIDALISTVILRSIAGSAA